ncbi:MAG: YbaB/EbfC family nucleoid-associated protein [Acidimicrobiales bacterium]
MTIEGPGPDPGSLLAQLGQAQESLHAAQESAAGQTIEGRAGGGAVTVTATGGLDFQAVRIDASVVDPADISLLEDLVLAAVRDAVERAQELQDQALGGIGGLQGLDGIGGLQGLLGP